MDNNCDNLEKEWTEQAVNDSDSSSSEKFNLIDFTNASSYPKAKPKEKLKFSERISLMSSYIQGDSNDCNVGDEYSPTEPLINDEQQHARHLQEITISPTDDSVNGEEPEGTISFLLQFMIPFLMAGIGQLMAGLILDRIQHWKVIESIPNIYILIPALLGLKGNCEMCLAARLSTQANVHTHQSTKTFFSLIFSNLGIVQVHSISIGFLAATGANTLGWIPQGEFDTNNALLLTASCLFTASMTSLVLGTVMIIVFFISKFLHINPDNVATPIAASLGDLTTVFILANATAIIIDLQKMWKWSPFVIIGGCFMLIPFWWEVAHRNVIARESLVSGWQPIVVAMIISSIGGLIMEYSILNFDGIAVYQLIVNGVAGNLVAVQASKLSTYLHKNYTLGENVPFTYNVRKIFFSNDANSHTARILLVMTIPGHLIFNYAVAALNAGHTSTTPIFMTVYLLASLIQVSILLYICHIMIHIMWKRCINPDNSAIPYLTAIADFLGMAFLRVAFQFLYLIGDRDEDIGD